MCGTKWVSLRCLFKGDFCPAHAVECGNHTYCPETGFLTHVNAMAKSFSLCGENFKVRALVSIFLTIF